MRFSTNFQSGTRAVPEADARVVVIDDDLELRASLGRLMRSVGLRSEQFASIAEFLESEPADCATCLILDVRLPGQSGLDFQQDLVAATVTPPIVFISGYGDIPMSVRAMKAGAIEFLTKPFRDQDLLDAVHVGLAKDREHRKNQAVMTAQRARFDLLTPRERVILTHVAAGRLNKQIAADIGITETTVKVHRSNAMRKIKAESLAELCRMVDNLKLTAEPPQSFVPPEID
jgi:FixJ family two-component response regulator